MRGIKLLVIGTLSMVLGSDLRAQETARTVRIKMDIENPSVEPPLHERDDVIVGPAGARWDSEVDESGSPAVSLVYRRKDKGYLILYHELEEAVVYDLEEFGKFTEKRDAEQEKLWERLASGTSPEESENLLKMRELRRETARLSNQVQATALKLEKTEESGELNGHPWTRYREFRSGTLSREFLVTPWEHLGIGETTAGVFEETAFFAEQRVVISEGLDRAPDPFQHFAEFGGFPVVVRQFDGEGKVIYESTVTAIEVVEDSAAPFQNPGYPETGLADKVRVIE